MFLPTLLHAKQLYDSFMYSPKPLSVVSSLQQSITSELPPSLSGTQDINLDVIDTPLIDSDFAHCLSKSFLSDFGDSFRSIYTHEVMIKFLMPTPQPPSLPQFQIILSLCFILLQSMRSYLVVPLPRRPLRFAI